MILSEHPPEREPIAIPLVNLAWPIALSMLSYVLMTAVDTLFVGRLGTEAIAAVGLGGLVGFTLLTFAMGILRGGKLVVAHAKGAGRDGDIPKLAAATVTLALVGSLGTWLATMGLSPFIGHIFREARASELTTSYIAVRALAIPLVLVATALREVSQGTGDSQKPMVAAVTANLANIPLNALFVLSLGWGVRGSALANVLAQLIDLLILSAQRRSWLLGLFPVDWRLVSRIARQGWPLGLEMFLDTGSFAALGFVLARLGAVQMAAHQIAVQVSHLVTLPIIALGEAASVLVGQAAGAHRLDRVPRILRTGIGTGLLFAAAVGALLLLARSAVVGCFTGDAEVQRLATILLFLVVGLQLAFSPYALGKSVLRALGDIKFASSITVVSAWMFTPPLAFVFGHLLGWGVVGGWCGLLVEVACATSLYLIRFERGGYVAQVGSLDVRAEPLPVAPAY